MLQIIIVTCFLCKYFVASCTLAALFEVLVITNASVTLHNFSLIMARQSRCRQKFTVVVAYTKLCTSNTTTALPSRL